MSESQSPDYYKNGKNCIYIQKKFYNTIYQENGLEDMLKSWAGDTCKQVFYSVLQVMELQNKTLKGVDKLEDLEELFVARNEWDNNVIAITGDRGSGKSSTLNNVVNYLRNRIIEPDTLNTLGYNDMEGLLAKTQVTCLGILDPTLFHESSIIEVIVSWMFRVFKEKLTKHDVKVSHQKRNVLSEFENIYKYLGMIRASVESRMGGDYIETLDILSSATKFKQLLTELVDNTLRFIHSSECTTSCTTTKYKLIIAIDDFDQEYNNAYTTFEMIRKYLMLPNVIILMGVNIRDLYYFMFKKMSSEIRGSSLFDTESSANSMSENYLQKLIPENHRIAIPTISKVRGNSLLFIENIDTDVYNKYLAWDKHNPNDVADVFHSNSILDRLSKLVFDSTSVLFLPNTEHLNVLYKMSLRDLNELIQFLTNLSHKNIETIEKVNHLLEFFVQWFHKYESKGSLKDIHKDIVSICKTNPKDRNKKLVQVLLSWIDNIDTPRRNIYSYNSRNNLGIVGEFHPALTDLEKPFCNPMNVAIADVTALSNILAYRIIDAQVLDALHMVKFILVILCRSDYLHTFDESMAIPFYHGLVTHNPLIRPERDKSRDTIKVDFKAITKSKKHICSLVDKLDSKNSMNCLVVSELEKAYDLFISFLYPRFPMKRTQKDKPISSRFDENAYYDLSQGLDSYTNVVFSLQAYLLRKQNPNGVIPVEHLDVIDYLFTNMNINIKEEVNHSYVYLLYAFLTLGKTMDSLVSMYPMYSVVLKGFADSFKNDEVFEMLTYIQLPRYKSHRSIQLLRSQEDSFEKLIKKTSVMFDNSAKQNVPDLTKDLQSVIEDSSLGGINDLSKVIRLAWFNAIYTYCLGNEDIVTEDADKSIDGLIAHFSILRDKILSNKIQEVVTRSLAQIRNDVKEAIRRCEDVDDFLLDENGMRRRIVTQLENLRARANVECRRQKVKNLSGQSLNWYVNGLAEIIRNLERLVNGRA